MKKQPSNIDILNIGNPCNQNCQQCYYVERKTIPLDLNQKELVKKIVADYPQSSIFVYPKEIANNQQLFPLIRLVGQKTVLSNGLLLNDKILKSLKEVGVGEIKITLFATAKEQKFFNGNDAKQYKQIIAAIKKCKKYGFRVTINNVLSKTNINSIGLLCRKCHNLKVDKIEFIRLKPIGNGRALQKILLSQKDVESIIIQVEKNKKSYPDLYLSFNLSFGPNFYGKSVDDALIKIKKSSASWTKSSSLCPAIGGNYWGVSAKTGKVYWCFFAMNEKISESGYYNTLKNKIIITNPPDLRPETLIKKLTGNCSNKKCIYTKVCLGGCRSTAYLFAKANGKRNPLYAGMDICLTKCYQKLNLKKQKAKTPTRLT